MEQEKNTRSQPRIWAVGGGKGGVGKSVLTSSLAIAAARQGRRCVLVDADLGGANLHTLLGLPTPRLSLGDLFSRKVSSLREILLPTPIPQLSLISGAGGLLEIANPHHAQKVKILRQLWALEADEIFLDLGAGAAFTVLDFFLAAHIPIVVVAPTPTSVENAYHFLKAAHFRKLKQALARAGILPLANRAMEEKMARGIRTPRDLLAEIRREAPDAARIVDRQIAGLTPRLLVNQARREEDLQLGGQMAEACREYFGLPIECLETLRHDDKVYAAGQGRRPVMQAFPNCPFAETVSRLVARLLQPPGETHV